MSNPRFNWSIPMELVPTCFTSVTHSIIGSNNNNPMDSWSVEEYDYNTMVLNFRTTSPEAGNIVTCYSDKFLIGTLVLDDRIEPFLFYSIKIEYPKEVTLPYIKYRKIVLKSQSNPSYPIFAYNSHTHLDLLSPSKNSYIAHINDGLVNEVGSIASEPNKLINESILTPLEGYEYITPIINDIYDFR